MKAVKYAFSQYKSGFAFLFLIKLFFVCVPFASMLLALNMYQKLTAVSVVEYSFSLLLIGLESVVISRFVVQFLQLPKFEFKIKNILHEKIGKINIEDYEFNENNHLAKRAMFASIQIYRIMEIVIGCVTSLFGMLLIIVFFVHISKLLSVILFLIIIVKSLFKFLQIKNSKKNIGSIQKSEVEADQFSKVFTDKAFAEENKILDNFSFLSKRFNSKNMKLRANEKAYSKKKNLLELIEGVIVTALIIGTYVSFFVVAKADVNVMMLIALLTGFLSISRMLNDLIEIAGFLPFFIDRSAPFFEFMELDELTQSFANDKISAKNLSYKYPNQENFSLNDVSFEIEAGTTTAIVGGNGSGKSTLTKILLGFYDNYDGVMNKVPFEDESAVLQNFCRYEMSRNENISFIEDDEPVFSGSGGQWQSVAIERGIQKTSKLIVFDEPNSALDIDKETELFETIAEIGKDKTVIMISHKLQYVKNADQILVMENGRIAERGRHDELLKIENGIYQTLWETQKSGYLEKV
ncbi:MAG: ATP-binding cassette domain-containing protein [Lactobacillales bacterium]|jgi:ATP-binding cassette subfamily B protein|nr:ATP-binding cassette domain-containing protein [Lactobacillales bacterium]